MALIKSRRFANDFKLDCPAQTVPAHRDLPFQPNFRTVSGSIAQDARNSAGLQGG
jgi:hypothetical protein